jgi:hypothetical protein
MRTISAAQAQVGDVVAEPVVNDQGRTLLPKGARLSPAVLSRLEGWGVVELCIEAEAEEPAVSDEVAVEDGADLLASLDHRFSAWEEDATMMHIRDIARRHLASLRRG